MIRLAIAVLPLCLSACAVSLPFTGGQFTPKGDYPQPLPAQSYAEPGQCSGGSRLAAREVFTPDYPRRAYIKGIQGWALVKLDVALDGTTENVSVVREAPPGWFASASRNAVEDWTFLPPQTGRMTDCLVRLDYRMGGVSISG